MNTGGGDDWYLKEWFAHLGRRQIDMVNELGWHRTTANRLWHGRQPYRRDQVNEAARWLGIKPFELLMKPEDALALRFLEETARAIAGRR